MATTFIVVQVVMVFPMASPFPKGSQDPNNRVLGPKYYSIYGTLALKPYHLGPWTLRVPHPRRLHPEFSCWSPSASGTYGHIEVLKGKLSLSSGSYAEAPGFQGIPFSGLVLDHDANVAGSSSIASAKTSHA